MNVDVIRTKVGLTIRWDDNTSIPRSWHVSKRFDPDTRDMIPATVFGSRRLKFDGSKDGRQVEKELHFANGLAEDMDRYFQRPEDFDLVTMLDRRTSGPEVPALIQKSDVNGKIYIAIAPHSTESLGLC